MSCARCGDFEVEGGAGGLCRGCCQRALRRWAQLEDLRIFILSVALTSIASGGWFLHDRVWWSPLFSSRSLTIIAATAAAFGLTLAAGLWLRGQLRRRAQLPADAPLVLDRRRRVLRRWLGGLGLLLGIQALRVIPAVQRVYENDLLEELGFALLVICGAALGSPLLGWPEAGEPEGPSSPDQSA